METLESPQTLDLERAFMHRLKERGKGQNTLKNYQNDLNCFNKFLTSLEDYDGTLIGHLEGEKVQRFYQFLKLKYPSENSLRRRIQAIRLFFDFLIQEYQYPENPIKRLAPPPKVLDLPNPPTPQKIQLLWSILLEKEKRSEEGLERVIAIRNQLLYLLILGSGTKVSDVGPLQKVNLLLMMEPRVLIQVKNRDPYTVPLLPLFKTIFEKYLNELQQYLFKIGLPIFSEVFFNANAHQILSGGLSSRGIENLFNEFSHWVGGEITAKSLRQACILRWLQEGRSEATLKEWLGLSPHYQMDLYRQVEKKYLFNLQFLKTEKSK